MARRVIQLRLALQVVVVVCALWWLLYWFLLPIDTAQRWLQEIDRKVNARFLGTKGSIFMLQALPVMLIAFLAYIIIALQRISSTSLSEQDEERKPRLNIWTLPIFLKSPLGMLTLGDLIFIVVVLFITFWYIIKDAVDASRVIDRNPIPVGLPSRYVSKFKAWGQSTGVASLIPFALLWIPVARGSPLLRVIGVPFEHAVKHHIWLGSLTVWLSAIHTAFTFVFLIHQRDIPHILSWRNGTYVACIPAMIAMGAGILMLVTALNPVRRRYFDLFFRVHHLYLVYLIFFGFHAFYEMYILIVPVLLFFLDRFMRMVQSHQAVDVVSAKVLPSGAMELRFAKPASLTYHALSFVYVLLPSVSRLQWHPFSVASSPLDGTNELSIYIKPLGKFTKNLHDALISSKDCASKSKSQGPGPALFKCPFSFKVGLEGPYGDESLFYLRYPTLIMVAGGIGVTPFLAMLRDILHRYQRHPFHGVLPTTVHLIFVCRQAYELDILDTLAPNTILPGYEEHLKIKIQAYVTAKIAAEAPQLVSVIDKRNRSTHIRSPWMEDSSQAKMNHGILMTPVGDSMGAHSTMNVHKEMAPGPRLIKRVSPFSSTGHTGWVALTVSATLIGFFVVWGIFNVTLIIPHTRYYHNWAIILFYILSVVLAVVPIGGGVMLLWGLYEKIENRKAEVRIIPGSDLEDEPHAMPTMSAITPSPSVHMHHGSHDMSVDIERAASVKVYDDLSSWRGDLVTGQRPNWKDIFNKVKIDFDGQDVGVVVSGSPFMQVDIARECKHHSLSRDSNIMMHYHSVSFEF